MITNMKIEEKYKAWTMKSVQRMQNVAAIHYKKDGSIDNVDVWSKDGRLLEGFVVPYECILLKYTGFTDAGHEELYDGDIFEDDAEWFKIEWDKAHIPQFTSTILEK